MRVARLSHEYSNVYSNGGADSSGHQLSAGSSRSAACRCWAGPTWL
jgi:hypothetical protein